MIDSILYERKGGLLVQPFGLLLFFVFTFLFFWLISRPEKYQMPTAPIKRNYVLGPDSTNKRKARQIYETLCCGWDLRCTHESQKEADRRMKRELWNKTTNLWDNIFLPTGFELHPLLPLRSSFYPLAPWPAGSMICNFNSMNSFFTTSQVNWFHLWY